MAVKSSDVFLYPQGSYEYVLLHGVWRHSRGKNISATLPGLKYKDPRLSFSIVQLHFQLTDGCLSVAVVDGVVYIGECTSVSGYLVRARTVCLNKDANPNMLAETGIYYPGRGQYIGMMGRLQEKPVFLGSAKAISANMDVWRPWYRFHSWGKNGQFEQLFGRYLNEPIG